MTSDAGIRMHVFEPSGRVIWMAVGSGDYWLDPDLGYCSCPAYHFSDRCHHLSDAESGSYERLVFSDEEFDGFVAALVRDTITRDTI